MVERVILSASVAPADIGVRVAHPTVVAGSTLDVEVFARATSGVTVTGLEVALVARIRFIHRELGFIGASSMSRSKRTEVHAVHHVPGPWPLASLEAVTLPVRLQVPESAPGTTHSDLVEIDWEVRVRLSATGFTYAEGSLGIVVLTAAPDRAQVAIAPPTGESRGVASLSFEGLSSRVLAPGRELSGTVAILPERRVAVRGVHVSLLLRQRVHRGEWTNDDPARNPAFQENERDSAISHVAVADALGLVPGHPVRLPFTLPARPELPGPSLHTPAFTVDWLLRADLDRGLRRRPFVEVELHGRTAPV